MGRLEDDLEDARRLEQIKFEISLLNKYARKLTKERDRIEFRIRSEYAKQIADAAHKAGVSAMEREEE